MNNLLKYSLLSILLALFIFACNDDPTSVGINLIPDEDKIQFAQFDSYEAQSFQKSSYHETNIKLGIAERIILGKTPYAESVMLLQYNVTLADSLMNYFKDGSLKISKVWMDLYPTYQIGNKSAIFDFTVHQVRTGWGPEGFDRDSLKNLQYDQTNVGLQNTLTVSDTLINIQLQTNVLNEWFKRKYDSLTTPKNYGLIFKPTTSTGRAVGFNALQLDASIKLPTLFAIVERSTTFKDTINFTPIIDAHVVNGSVPNVSDKMFISGGQALRSTLFFELNTLPKNIILNKAVLELTLDTLSTTNGSPGSDTLIVQTLSDYNTHKLSSDSLLYISLYKNGNKFSGDVSWLLQNWISRSETNKNEGVLLSLFDEKNSFSQLCFYGSSFADKTKRPLLKLIYSQKK